MRWRSGIRLRKRRKRVGNRRAKWSRGRSLLLLRQRHGEEVRSLFFLRDDGVNGFAQASWVTWLITSRHSRRIRSTIVGSALFSPYTRVEMTMREALSRKRETGSTPSWRRCWARAIRGRTGASSASYSESLLFDAEQARHSPAAGAFMPECCEELLSYLPHSSPSSRRLSSTRRSRSALPTRQRDVTLSRTTGRGGEL